MALRQTRGGNEGLPEQMARHLLLGVICETTRQSDLSSKDVRRGHHKKQVATEAAPLPDWRMHQA